jgi:leucyl-tRNA synthetase
MSANTDTPVGNETPDTPPFRYSAALARDIELRWQDWWDTNGTFETPNPAGPLGDADLADQRGEKLFVLDMFPYPSGAGLHVGHPLGFIGTDVFARFKRMTGHNVLHTMGFDAFGLPAEQYAVEHGVHPAITTDENIATYRRQLRRLGLAHDQRRSISTTDPQYYRWTQWIFSQIFNAWFDPETPNAGGGLGKARPIGELVAEFEIGARPTPDGRDWHSLDLAEQRSIIDGYRLAYVSEAPVNWCPGLGTVVANEEVTADGRSDRGNFPVFKRNMRQWMMRITAYADRLIDDLETLEWTDAIKAMQRNWIGRSHGANVHFPSPAGDITVFTTRPDTLFGATFMVLAPEHPYVEALTIPEQADAVAEYRRQAAAKKDIDRQDENREKTGVWTGSYATNPLSGEQIPVWIADYVLMGYGTGAIMAVPCGDQRDFEFARRFGLGIPAIQRPPMSWFEDKGVDVADIEQGRVDPLDTSLWPVAYVGDAPYVNSSNDTLSLDGIASKAEGITTVNAWLEQTGTGEPTITYKLRDWLFSRQRYWGEPFPIVYDAQGTPHSLPDEMLPVELPETDSFSPRTFDADDEFSDPESPLDRLGDWVTVTLDLGDGPQEYRRDTNVMPQWAGSCWYQLRYCDPTNDEVFIDPAVESYWVGPRPERRADHPGGVDLYVGGVEHAVLHLLYARFWHKVLFDLGHVSSMEPYARLFNQGYVQAYAYTDERGIYVDAKQVVERDGEWWLGDPADGQKVNREYGKMGKSLKNVVSPDDMYEEYGADTLRLYEMATGPLDASRPWETRDVVGMNRFLQRLWRNVVDEQTGECTVSDETSPDEELLKQLHRTIDVVRTEMDALRFNTAIAKLIELNNALTKLPATPRSIAEPLVLMAAPLVPHLAEEIWRKLGHTETVTYLEFPTADERYLVDDTVEIPVQVNGKVRGRITVAADADQSACEAAALADDKVVAALGGATPKKVIVVPGRMINIVV